MEKKTSSHPPPVDRVNETTKVVETTNKNNCTSPLLPMMDKEINVSLIVNTKNPLSTIHLNLIYKLLT